jgi:hypothetical protein
MFENVNPWDIVLVCDMLVCACGLAPGCYDFPMHKPISRREMLQTSVGLLAAGAIYPLSARAAGPDRKVLHLPSLHDRAKLAMQCLNGHSDAARGHVPYFYTRMSDRPPAMFICEWSYGDGMGRSVDALGLLRQITGEPLQAADHAMIAALIGTLGEDGLSWCPAEPFLMAVPHTRPTWLQAGPIMAFGTLYGLTGERLYQRYVQRLIAALDERVVRQPGQPPTFPGDVYTHVNGWEPKPTSQMDPFSLYCTSVTMPLFRYYRLTGYEPAFRFASEMLDGALQTYGGGSSLFDRGHFHCRSRVVTSLLQRAVIKNRAEDFALAEQLYKKARALGTQSGWFPEQINNPENNRSNLSETCALVDMIESAILLAQHHDPAYWHDVERYAHNHILVHQMVDTGWEKEMTAIPLAKHPLRFPGDNQPAFDGMVRGDQVMPSLVGGFAGWGGVTAMSDDSAFGNTNQHCCNGSGARALYDLWHYAVSDQDGEFKVNLHLARNHAAAEITAAELRESNVGVLRIKARQDRRLLVRIPEFVSAGKMNAAINGQPVSLREQGAFVSAGAVRPGDQVEVSYPLEPRTTEERVAPGAFTFFWRGATVVAASPEQKIRPLFNDARFLESPPAIGPVPAREIDSI